MLNDSTITFKVGTLIIGTFELKNVHSDKRILVGELLGLSRENTENENLIKILRVFQTLDDNPRNDFALNIPKSEQISIKVSTTMVIATVGNENIQIPHITGGSRMGVLLIHRVIQVLPQLNLIQVL